MHWGVPEGSYSTQPDGLERILEYRHMVQALHALGLRVVLDVVYNHVFAAGPSDMNSVLDKIVPGTINAFWRCCMLACHLRRRFGQGTTSDVRKMARSLTRPAATTRLQSTACANGW